LLKNITLKNQVLLIYLNFCIKKLNLPEMNEARTEEPFIRKFKNREEVSIDFEVFTNLTKNFKIFSKKNNENYRGIRKG
jgi:hypothetical protein